MTNQSRRTSEQNTHNARMATDDADRANNGAMPQPTEQRAREAANAAVAHREAERACEHAAWTYRADADTDTADTQAENACRWADSHSEVTKHTGAERDMAEAWDAMAGLHADAANDEHKTAAEAHAEAAKAHQADEAASNANYHEFAAQAHLSAVTE